MITLGGWLILVGYWIRPYDIARDARRWRWQRRGCWRASAAGREWQQRLQDALTNRPVGEP